MLKPTVVFSHGRGTANAPFCVGFAAEAMTSSGWPRGSASARSFRTHRQPRTGRARQRHQRSDLLDDAGAQRLPRMDKLALARRLVNGDCAALASRDA
jgi:hypothetical protein